MPIIDEKLNGNVNTVYFEESPIMSTYLVAIVVGLFNYIGETTVDGIKVRVFCPVGKSDEGKFALDVAVKSLDIFTKYFSMPYPLPKLDILSVPEFSGGAMENYGLIIYRETVLLHNDLFSETAKKQDISYIAADIMFPERKIWTQFLQETNGGLYLDAQEQSHPIEMEIHHVHLLGEIFDSISFDKGSAVIRMLQEYLGDRIFQKSLSSYMKRYASRNAKTDDLCSVLSEEPGTMDSWTKQKGHPFISETTRDHILEFLQSQFSSSGLHGEGQWIVPITLALGSHDKRSNFLLESRFERVNLSELFPSSDGKNQDEYSETSWVKVNVEQSGILDDMYALTVACEQSLSSLLTLMFVYKKEVDYIVLSKLIDVCYNVVRIIRDAIPDFINLLLFSAEKLGSESVPGESHLNALLREEVLMALAAFDHNKTHKEAMQRFQTFLADRNTLLLSADTKRAAYISVMRNAITKNRDGFEFLLERFVSGVRVHFFRSNFIRPLFSIFRCDVGRDQDIVCGLAGISLEGCEIAWEWLKG
ncbi:hypothetical protein REPUB_Repub14bG0069300 [Reevesia pubescens]